MQTLFSEDVFTDKLVSNARVVLPGEGRRMEAQGGSCTFKITSEISNRQLGVYEIVVPPHSTGARPHFHRYMDEVFIVKKGLLTLQLGREEQVLPEGAVAYVPRYTPHAFSNTSGEELVLTLIFNPSENREGYFTGLFELLQAPELDLPRFLQLAQKYDTHHFDPATLPV
ncbi:MAG: cupin domain-containing protein [Chitinophagaceae bacterium]|nr:MAG: cupin domain-containing protein [Chitinophagaceae bacterium]